MNGTITVRRPRVRDLEDRFVVEHHFRALNAPHLCTAVSDGVIYRDGVRELTPTRKLRAA